jgi:hypothetical protein
MFTSRTLRWYLVSLGLLYGYFFNSTLSALSDAQHGLTVLYGLSIGFFILIFVFWYVNKLKALSLSFPAMVRLSLLGMAIISFIYAFADILCFYNSGLSVGSFLASIAFGGFLTVFERFIDLYERKELW